MWSTFSRSRFGDDGGLVSSFGSISTRDFEGDLPRMAEETLDSLVWIQKTTTTTHFVDLSFCLSSVCYYDAVSSVQYDWRNDESVMDLVFSIVGRSSVRCCSRRPSEVISVGRTISFFELLPGRHSVDHENRLGSAWSSLVISIENDEERWVSSISIARHSSTNRTFSSKDSKSRRMRRPLLRCFDWWSMIYAITMLNVDADHRSSVVDWEERSHLSGWRSRMNHNHLVLPIFLSSECWSSTEVEVDYWHWYLASKTSVTSVQRSCSLLWWEIRSSCWVEKELLSWLVFLFRQDWMDAQHFDCNDNNCCV